MKKNNFYTSNINNLLFVGLCLFVLFFYWPQISEKYFVWFDAFNQFQIRLEYLANTLANGKLPLWDCSVYGGSPFFAEQQNACLYPFNLLIGFFTWLFPPYKMVYFVYAIVIETLFCLAGLYFFSQKNLKYLPLAATFTASIFIFSTSTITRVLLYPQYTVITFIPWLIIGVMGLRNAKLNYILILGLLWGMALLGGTQQYSYYLVIAISIYAAIDLIDLWITHKSYKLTFILFRKYFSFSIIGFAISAIYFIPVAKYFSTCGRYFEKASGTPIAYFITYIIPNFFGKLCGEPSIYFGKSGFWSYWEQSNYTGIIPLVIFITFMLFIKKDKLWYFTLILLLFSWLYAFGENNQLPRLLPFGANIRNPGRFFIFSTLAISLFCGKVINELILHNFSQIVLKKIFKITITLLLLSFLVALLWFAGIINKKFDEKQIIFINGGIIRSLTIFFVYCVSFWLFIKKKYNAVIFIIILITVTLFDLISYNRTFHNGKISPKQFFQVNSQVKSLQFEMKQEPFRIDGGMFTFCNLRATHYGLQALNGYSPYSPPWFNKLKKIKNKNIERYYDLLNVKYVFDLSPNGYRIKKRHNVLPRVFLVNHLIHTNENEILNVLLDKHFNIRKYAVVSTKWLHLLSYTNSLANSFAKIISYTPEKIVINVNSTSTAYLIISESRIDGWKVYVDGNENQWFPVNYNFRGVKLKKGTHKIVWKYSTPGLKLGAIISAAAFIFIIVAFIKQKK